MNSETLRNVRLFESLDKRELDALSELTFVRTFEKDNVIIWAEDKGDALFIIADGKVKVSIVSEDGREVILSLLSKNAVFGELSLLDGRPRSANVIAIEETQLVMLRRADFLELIQKTPSIAVALLAELASRLRKTDRQIEGLALLDVASRISDTLLQLAIEQGVESNSGIVVENRPTHQEIANMSGTTRETVSRVLKRLEKQGYLKSEGRKITILRDKSQTLQP
jgi:CRP/FNR family cyclic AMP-dependent transcriptional regulator|tara:strand:+ start:424 stop:1098 length:675 start_codon:yes stop_codon:yes gene_type:complete